MKSRTNSNYHPKSLNHLISSHLSSQHHQRANTLVVSRRTQSIKSRPHPHFPPPPPFPPSIYHRNPNPHPTISTTIAPHLVPRLLLNKPQKHTVSPLSTPLTIPDNFGSWGEWFRYLIRSL